VPKLESSMAPSHLLQRLEDYVNDWHESRLPPELVRRGIYGLTLHRAGNRFRLSVRGGWFRERSLECRGVVSGSNSSVISYSVGIGRVVWYALVFGDLAVLAALRNDLPMAAVALLFVCVVGGLNWLVLQRLAVRLQPSFDLIMCKVVTLDKAETPQPVSVRAGRCL
jgi:hypothetical protein